MIEVLAVVLIAIIVVGGALVWRSAWAPPPPPEPHLLIAQDLVARDLAPVLERLYAHPDLGQQEMRR